MDFIIIGNNKISTLVALTEDEQRIGLMGNIDPPIMSFPYDSAKIRKFWMMNCPSALDIIFCRGNKVVDIIKGKAYSLEHIGPHEPTDLVIEMKAGEAKNLGLKKGSDIKLAMGLNTLLKKFSNGG